MVKIGGVNVKDIPKEELMNTVSFVFQNSRLIKASILENVRMGKPEATREEILAALHHAQCDDILEKLPQGVDTVVGTKGVYLSGGEQQRVAVARALAHSPRLVIADEPTGNVDPEMSHEIVELLTKINNAGTTVIMVTHEHDLVRSFQRRVIVIKNGEVVSDTAASSKWRRNTR